MISNLNFSILLRSPFFSVPGWQEKNENSEKKPGEGRGGNHLETKWERMRGENLRHKRTTIENGFWRVVTRGLKGITNEMQICARENPFPKIHFACSIYYELRGTASQRRNIFSADVLPQPFAEMASESPTHPVFARCKTIFPRRAKGCQIVHIYTTVPPESGRKWMSVLLGAGAPGEQKKKKLA